MRIDLTQTAANQIASEPNLKPASASDVAASDPAGAEDRTTLSSSEQSLRELVSTAMSSPDDSARQGRRSDAGNQCRQV